VYTAEVAPTRPLLVTRDCRRQEGHSAQTLFDQGGEMIQPGPHLEQTVDTTDGELQTGPGGPAGRLLLVSQLLVSAHGALGTLA
jgi:hypothetical protein